MSFKRMVASIFAVSSLLFVSYADAGLIADSVVEFSNVQGQDNWYYGYYDGDHPSSPWTPEDFESDMVYIESESRWKYGTWTYIWANGVHPDAGCWVVRRWVSEVSSPINIAGDLRRPDSRGDGTIASILVDGSQVYIKDITDTALYNYDINALVNMGSIIDFVVDPKNDITFDTTTFTIQICAIPIPSAVWLLGSGLIGLVGLRRKFRK